VIHYKFGVY